MASTPFIPIAESRVSISVSAPLGRLIKSLMGVIGGRYGILSALRCTLLLSCRSVWPKIFSCSDGFPQTVVQVVKSKMFKKSETSRWEAVDKWSPPSGVAFDTFIRSAFKLTAYLITLEPLFQISTTSRRVGDSRFFA